MTDPFEMHSGPPPFAGWWRISTDKHWWRGYGVSNCQKEDEMPAYNFQPRFAPLVESGQKRQTIRQTAKGAKSGATAYLYTGQHTAHCRKLGEGTITDVLPIEIGRHACGEPYACIIERNGKQTHLAHDRLDSLAREDGFANGEEMAEWFADQYGLPFTGYLHQWVPSNVEFSGVPAGHSSNHPAGGTSAGTQGIRNA